MKDSRSVLYQSRPANFQADRWKDATPLGNGETGILLFGDVGEEHLRFTRCDLWEGENDPVPPDAGETLAQTRALLDKKEYEQANRCLYDELKHSRYACSLAVPFPLCDVNLAFSYKDGRFREYRRSLFTDTALSEVRYRLSSGLVSRKCFVSRKDGLAYMRIESEAPVSVRIYPALPAVSSRADDPFACRKEEKGLCFSRPYRGGRCGLCIFPVATDGTLDLTEEAVCVCSFTELTVAFGSFSKEENAFFSPAASFEEAFEANKVLFSPLFSRSSVCFSENSEKSNEELTLEAFENEASPELLEKLWRFGRYLFLSGTSKNALPFPLYGLWAGDYALPWSQNVSNENVQILYWHTLTGNLPELLLPLIRYYYEKIPQFRENARSLFGCRGIVVSAYTTPYNSHIAPAVPVILNFTTASGWLCRSFFDYYDMTGDEETFSSMILPFALETAAFIEDFAVIREGVLIWYPSVSPENSPEQFHGKTGAMAHPMPTAVNATIELAIVKETLTRLSALCLSHNLYPEKIPVWKRIRDAVPAYRVNADGAVREWQWDGLLDHYRHRHLSHIYPVFPGNEVTKETDPDLFRAFERAVDLRELGSQSGWSLAHTAGIDARFGRGNGVMDCLDILCRGCLCDNFFTVHNDWRDNHLTLSWQNPPIQLDALMGAVSAIQQMLLDFDGKTVRLLPALPDRLAKGEAQGLAVPGCTVDLAWDKNRNECRAVLHATRSVSLCLDIPHFSEGTRSLETVSLGAGESAVLSL